MPIFSRATRSELSANGASFRSNPPVPHRPQELADDEISDRVAERLPGVLVVAEVLTGVDATRGGLVGGLREALETPHDARNVGIRQREIETIGAEEVAQGSGRRLADLRMRPDVARVERRHGERRPVRI